mmetsp:Transcript_4485/g.11835  ORF Transcript_4485/g.11835 Transcript_4485/m.11835 type:complete len:246 (-) Transcript_4485:25-762(-)
MIKGDHGLLLVLGDDRFTRGRACALLLQLGNHLALVILPHILREELVTLQLFVEAPDRGLVDLEVFHRRCAFQLLAFFQYHADVVVVGEAHRVDDHHGTANVVDRLLESLSGRWHLARHLSLSGERLCVLDGALDDRSKIIRWRIARSFLAWVVPKVGTVRRLLARREVACCCVVILEKWCAILETLLLRKLHGSIHRELLRGLGKSICLSAQILHAHNTVEHDVDLGRCRHVVEESVLFGPLDV